jgi:CTP:phosphocholine cytidylyltransferase-like protein
MILFNHIKKRGGGIMKLLFCILASAVFAASAYSQSLRVTFNGNKDFQLVVDGTTYKSSSYLNNDVVLNNLSGNHTVTIYRINRNGKSKRLYSSTVNLSPNQEVHLTVNNNGGIEREETSSNAAYGYRTPMSDAGFNVIYRDVNNRWGQSSKMTAARDAFNSGSNYFSTAQVRQIVELMNSEANRLELLKLAYDNITDPVNFYLLYDLLQSQANRTELDRYVRSYNPEGPYNNYKVAMNTTAFNQLYQDVSRQSNTSRKLSEATKAFNTATNYFSVLQASQLISLVTGENNRLQLAKLSLDNIIDPENITQLFDLLTTQSAKENLDYYIRNNGYAGANYNYTVRAAMTDAEFNTLYNDIRRKWLPLSKYSTAVDIFSSTSNYFTTQQVKQIIALLSSESNRLDLAKLAFDNIVDQQNFRQLYDLFDSQASRDELDNYIRANGNSQ